MASNQVGIPAAVFGVASDVANELRAIPGAFGPTHIRNLEDPIDPEVGVLCVQTESPDVRAFVLHHTATP